MTDDAQEIERLTAALDETRRELAYWRQQAQSTENNFNTLFEQVGDAIFIINFGDYRILQANQHAARRLGYTINELKLLTLNDIEVPPDESETDYEQMNVEAWVSPVSDTYTYERFYRHKEGHLIPVEVSSRVVETNGQRFLQNIVRNIELRKQMEAEKQELIADLDDFAHTVAHDLKNPLSTIVSYSIWLEDSWQDLREGDLRQGLFYIAQQSHKAIHIVDDLLLLASVRQQEKVPRKPLDMQILAIEAALRLEQMIEQQQAQIIYPKQWHIALGYGPWVTEIWLNYLSNAIKYGGEQPRIELGSDLVAEGRVRFWVRDYGEGIPADQHDQLFKQFSRLTDADIDGHGLGLSIVKRIAEKLDGDVSVESEVGKGSIFSFTLPRAPKPSQG